MINVFIIGSKGIPAKYGGFETFVENLTKRKTNNNIHYFVSCMADDNKEYEHNGAHCFSIPIKKDSAFNRLINVSDSLKWVERFVSNTQNQNNKNIVYILGCRVGLLLKKHSRKLHKLGCILVCNPDGLEWKRNKWKGYQKKILLMSEKKLVKYCDYIICDSKGIQQYILDTYKFVCKENVSYIAYGSDIKESTSSENELNEWLSRFGCKPNDYYLVVGRFVPENNYELMIKEFMESNTAKKLLLITNVEKNEFYNKLSDKLHFEDDKRIIFAGTLYNEELLRKVRENAFAYIHGHSVGGTNPSLLEALASTKINILFDVSFNKEVGENQCLYFGDKEGNLVEIINNLEKEHNGFVNKLNSREIIEKRYSWEYIVDQYEDYFLNLGGKI